jgi:hypothetical protein
MGAVRSPSGYRTYTIEVVTSDPDAAREAVSSAAVRAPTGRARLAEGLLDGIVKAQMPEDTLLAGPIVYTLDEAAVERYQRRVLVRS